MTKYQMKVNNIANKLLEDPYYETVAFGFITDAIDQAVEDVRQGKAKINGFNELNNYIKENLI